MSDVALSLHAAAMWAAPAQLTAQAVSGSVSARSTAVYAARLMAKSGVSRARTASTPALSVISMALRSSGKIAYRGGQAARQTSRPTCPPDPKTRIFIQLSHRKRAPGEVDRQYRARRSPLGQFYCSTFDLAADLAALAEEAVEIGDGAGEAGFEVGGGMPAEESGGLRDVGAALDGVVDRERA